MVRVLWELATEEWNGSPVNGAFFHRKDTKYRKKSNTLRTRWYCTFHKQCNCLYRVATIEDCDSKLAQIFIGSIPHVDHSVNKFKRALPLQIKTLVAYSPSQLKFLPPQALLHKASLKIQMNKDMQRRAKRQLAYMRSKSALLHLCPGSDGKRWGDLAVTLDAMMRSKIDKQEFDEHTVFICGDEYYMKPSENRFYAALSTEDLLLNAYRQLASSQDMSIAVDTSYRYTTEKSGLMPIRTISFNQRGHIIAYGVVSNEDEHAHEFIFRKVREAVEDVVRRRQESGTPI
jgi:hypothetical protein